MRLQAPLSDSERAINAASIWIEGPQEKAQTNPPSDELPLIPFSPAEGPNEMQIENWTIEDSAELYNIDNWGAGFFCINGAGNVEVTPSKDGRPIELLGLAQELERRKISLPVLLRFSDILNSRIHKLNDCFANASREFEYKGGYRAVYPIKVNQERHVIEEILSFGREHNIGLEAGSKPELHAVLAMMDNLKALIICNGYKDDAYIRLALMGQKLQRKIIIVVEKLQELKLILAMAEDLGIAPCIGLRVKLVSGGSGRWEKSAGEHSKFGLTAAEIMAAVEMAKEAGYLDAVELLHFHLGSQITNIRHIKDGMKEICRFYKELTLLGCGVRYVDVGGGLGVDYEGTRSTNESSTNYSIEEYANDIVYSLASFCEEEDLKHPEIITESGRALTAHHTLMLFNVVEATCPPTWDDSIMVEEDDDIAIHDLHQVMLDVNEKNMLEFWHDALELKDQAMTKFSLGLIGLPQRAKAERLFWSAARKIEDIRRTLDFSPEDMDHLRVKLANKYFCNFSVFQSLPDTWAIDQLFPIMPIHRLNEEPDQEATLQDITCDSDGKVDKFIRYGEIDPLLPVHQYREGETYVLGAFLVGAYQEILGDLHNLFGDTHTVHVALNPNGEPGWRIDQVVEGDRVEEVLGYVSFRGDELMAKIRMLVGISQGMNQITDDEAEELLTLYREGLKGYTYLLSHVEI